MTPRVGDRVRIDVEGVVEHATVSGGALLVTLPNGRGRVSIPARECVVVESPAEVGDVLNARSSEPACGTLIVKLNDEGSVYRQRDGSPIFATRRPTGWDIHGGSTDVGWRPLIGVWRSVRVLETAP